MSDKRILKKMVRENDQVIGLIQQLVYPEITEALSHCDLDYLVVDLEHTAKTIESAASCLMVGAAMNVPMLVRVREKEQSLIEEALDAGAQGVVVPTVETVEDCELIVRSAKFAPEGERGWCPVLPAKRWLNSWEGDLFGDDFDPETYGRAANDQVFLVALVETPLGVQNLPEMLEVPGIDAFMLGSGDLSIRMGRTLWDPEVADVVANAIDMIEAAGKISCPIGTADNMDKLVQSGSRMMTLGLGDRAALQGRLRGEISQMRSTAATLSARGGSAGRSV